MVNNDRNRRFARYGEQVERIAELASDMPMEYLECRNGNHNYKPRTVTWIPRERIYEVIQRCTRCKAAERTWELDQNGFIINARTNYITARNRPSYVIKGLGRPGQAGRAAIRLELITRYQPVTREEPEE